MLGLNSLRKTNRVVQTPHVQCLQRIFTFKRSRHLMRTACKHNAQRRELIEETQWQKIASLSKRPPKTPLVTCSTVITLTTPKCKTLFEKLKKYGRQHAILQLLKLYNTSMVFTVFLQVPYDSKIITNYYSFLKVE